MPEAVEIQPITSAGLAKIFRTRIGSVAVSTASTRHKAVVAWTRWTDTPAFAASAPMSRHLIASWVAFLWATGISYSTAKLYLDSLAAIYGAAVKEGTARATDAFKEVRAILGGIGPQLWSAAPSLAACEAVAAITRAADGANPRMNLAADMVRFSLLNAAAPLCEVVASVKADVGTLPPDAAYIAGRHISAARKYIFPLRQGSLTPRQTCRSAESIIVQLLATHGIALTGGIDALLAGSWLREALSMGFDPAQILSCLGNRAVPGPVPVLCQAEEIDDYSRLRLTIAIGHSFVENPLRWYAMRLRPGVKYDHIVARLDALGPDVRPEQTFYPYREIAHRTGKKLVFRQQPYIADVVFFQAPETAVKPLFAQIGDLAWCYTTTGRPGGTYAAIPNTSFLIFQRTIAHFTPEYEVAPAGTLAPRPNEHVVVIGGLFSGHTATVSNIGTPDTLYRLNLVGTNGIEWRLSVDPRLLTPAR